VSFYVSTATFFLLHCDEWDRVVALPRHKFVTGATLLQLFDDSDVGVIKNLSMVL
jgi:restriction endonuclease Mrr